VYREGKTIREYTTGELMELGSGFSPSRSHYTIFRRRLGFRPAPGNKRTYAVEGASGKVFSFDLETGLIVGSTTEQPGGP
jgi:hypothetical protein